MALNDKVLQDFFSRPQRSPKLNETSIKPIEEGKASSPTPEETQVNHFRVFDDPTKPENLGQTSDKLRTEPRTNLGQSQDKLRTNLGQDIEELSKTSDKPRTELRTELRTNLGQSQDKLRTNEVFSALIGLQRKIVLFVYDECKFMRDKMTRPLSVEYIANSCQTTKLSAQKTIQRLEKKHIILRKNFKNGRGGWTQYELPDSIFQEAWQSETSDKLRTNLGQSQDKLRTEPRTELRTSVPSSSSGSSINNNTTTTRDEFQTKQTLPEEWSSIDIEPLTEIGFSATHLWQLAQQNKLNPEMVQDSIHAFAFDLRRNNRGSSIRKGSPLNFFMGILRNGQPYTPPENYESPQEEALRKYYEHKKAEEANRVKIEQELMEIAFNDWFSALDEQSIVSIVPAMYRDKSNDHIAKRSFLKEHFKNYEWPIKRGEILKIGTNN